MLVTSPPEKETTIRGSAKHYGNVPSGSCSSGQNINKGGRRAWGAGPASTEAESLGAGPLGPERPCFEVTSLPSPGGSHRRQRHTSRTSQEAQTEILRDTLAFHRSVLKCHGLGRVRRHTQRTTVIPAEITPSRELAQRGDLLSSGRSGKGETPRMRRGPSRRVKDILGGSSMCKGPARLEGHARGAVAGSRTGRASSCGLRGSYGMGQTTCVCFSRETSS